jgi:hypothetical protein
MKNLLTFGLVAWFFLVLAGCAHTPDSPGSMAKQQQTVAAPTSGTPAQETAAAQTNGTPAVEVSEMVFDFGEVTEGNDYVHAFKIRNTGTGVLVIKKIVPG